MPLKPPKWRLFALAAITAFTLAACGDINENEAGGNPTGNTPGAQTPGTQTPAPVNPANPPVAINLLAGATFALFDAANQPITSLKPGENATVQITLPSGQTLTANITATGANFTSSGSDTLTGVTLPGDIEITPTGTGQVTITITDPNDPNNKADFSFKLACAVDQPLSTGCACESPMSEDVGTGRCVTVTCTDGGVVKNGTCTCPVDTNRLNDKGDGCTPCGGNKVAIGETANTCECPQGTQDDGSGKDICIAPPTSAEIIGTGSSANEPLPAAGGTVRFRLLAGAAPVNAAREVTVSVVGNGPGLSASAGGTPSTSVPVTLADDGTGFYGEVFLTPNGATSVELKFSDSTFGDLGSKTVHCACANGSVPSGATCVPLTSITCPAGQVPNTSTGKCEACPTDKPNAVGIQCLASCTAGQHTVNDNCVCQSPLQENLTTRICDWASCPAGQVLNTSTGKCEDCPTDKPHAVGGECLASCTAGQNTVNNKCVCQSPLQEDIATHDCVAPPAPDEAIVTSICSAGVADPVLVNTACQVKFLLRSNRQAFNENRTLAVTLTADKGQKLSYHFDNGAPVTSGPLTVDYRHDATDNAHRGSFTLTITPAKPIPLGIGSVTLVITDTQNGGKQLLSRKFKVEDAGLVADETAIGIVGTTKRIEPLDTANPSNRSARAKSRALDAQPALPVGAPVDITLPPLAATRSAPETPQMGRPTPAGSTRQLDDTADADDVAKLLQWQPLAGGGQAAALRFTSPGAQELRLVVDAQQIPDGAVLRFYGADGHSGGEVLEIDSTEAARQRTLNERAGLTGATARLLWSHVISGDSATLEIELPAGTPPEALAIAVPHLAHLVLPVRQPMTRAIGTAADCHLNLTCELDKLNAESRAIAQMSFYSGGTPYVCSGTLLNDSNDSRTPYFLTAGHCISTPEEAASLVTRWFYRAESCDPDDILDTRVMKQLPAGADLLYNSSEEYDITLLQLRYAPPDNVVYAGSYWGSLDINDSVLGAHHPDGDLQKYSVGTIDDYARCENGRCRIGNDSSFPMYYTIWSRGFSEGGSSGSGLFVRFDGKRYLVGVMHGGPPNSYCGNPDHYTLYGRYDGVFDTGIKPHLVKP